MRSTLSMSCVKFKVPKQKPFELKVEEARQAHNTVVEKTTL